MKINYAIEKLLRVLIIVTILAGLYLVSMYNYLLFHTLVEVFSIIIAGTIFALAWNFQPFYSDSFLIYLGIAYLSFASLDLLHTLTFKGMDIFAAFDINQPTQLWIAARYLQAFSFLLAPLFLGRKVKASWLAAAFALVTVLLALSIMAWDIFPTSYVEGVGLTPFKIISEYIIDVILIGAVIFLWRSRQALDRRVLNLLILSIVSTIVSELTFTFYIDVYGFLNLIGHFFKVISYYLVYKSIIETAAIKIYADMTQLRETEKALRESEAREHSRVAELEMLATKLERSNQDLEQFAYVASHDLQEPLRKVSAFGQRLQQRLAGQLDETDEDFLERMVGASRRMQAMIEALLAYSRVTTKGQPFQTVELDKVFHEVLSDLEVSIEQSEGKVSVESMPAIQADPVQMHQLLLNLVGNALKFHEPGKMPVVDVTCSEGIDRQSHRPIVEVRVRDQGIGFDEQYLEQIFRPFERLHGRSEYEGTGIGLALCKKIVERHGGTITAQSSPGKGTTFIVRLPITQL